MVVEFFVYGASDFDFVVAPNPAMDSIVFLFNLSQPGDVEISIFNVAGDKIITKNIADNSTFEGINKKTWDACNKYGQKIASGIYIAYLKTLTGSQTTKFAFVKN